MPPRRTSGPGIVAPSPRLSRTIVRSADVPGVRTLVAGRRDCQGSDRAPVTARGPPDGRSAVTVRGCRAERDRTSSRRSPAAST
ncbi:hypothetical protein ACFPM0_05670 [Pseudonocardia sulfidoxydans]|uniref:hypothetical protein n=1 Tax=Pseudonocardia sulfidoxydans TaxID=54011 RepID=UPI00361717F6